MRRRQHALSGAIYEVRDDGNLDVTARDGSTGVFAPNGEWIEGDVHHADPHLCGWLAGPQLPPQLAVLPRFRETECDTGSETGAESIGATI
jgi:hypothetical protein